MPPFSGYTDLVKTILGCIITIALNPGYSKCVIKIRRTLAGAGQVKKETSSLKKEWFFISKE